MRRSPRRAVLVAVLAATLAVGLVSCGDDDDPVDSSACVAVAPTGGVTHLSVVGKNMAFDEECFQIEPGPVEFTLVNDDDGVSHNLHVTGQGVNEATPLERGKNTQVLELDLTEPGTYGFKCDPHPSMKGKLVVAEASSTTAEPTTTAG